MNTWQTIKDISLYPWQQEAIDKWFVDKRGTMKVVTGAGKTILALAIIERLQHENPELRVAIVVPTIVLLNQWRDEIMKHSNLPADTIGFLGGGHRDTFADKRILICVLKSASDKLSGLVDGSVAENLLLIVDECHRAGATEMRKVFKTSRAYNLGLSATPEREEYFESDSGVVLEEEYNESLLGTELGPIVFEMTLNEAFAMGILPKFTVNHYGLYLTGEERAWYESLSRSIQDLASELRERSGKRSGDALLFSWCQNAAKRDGVTGDLARKYIYQTGQRKRLLYNARARLEAVVNLLRQEFTANPDAKAILFHESIEGVEKVFQRLQEESLSVVMENSKLPESERAENIEAFRDGRAQVIVSARSLIEGFNVPSTDIGIVVASSTSIRQRIQTLGRVLRKPKDGRDKQAVVHVLYIHDTTDEMVYAKADWGKLVGSERNNYFLWDLKEDPVEQPGPPREPLPKEKDILPESLTGGQEYPGDYEGEDFTCDSKGNIFTGDGKVVVNPGDLPQRIEAVKGSFGRFKVTPLNNYVLVLSKVEDGWVPLYVTRLEQPFEFAGDRTEAFNPDLIQPGDSFPAEMVGEAVQLVFKQSRGRHVIAKKMPRGEVFARVDNATDPDKRGGAKKLLEARQAVAVAGYDVSKFLLTSEGYAVFLEKGTYRFLAKLEAGLEFPF
jgi:superfamily II DNA or RNA helicase